MNFFIKIFLVCSKRKNARKNRRAFSIFQSVYRFTQTAFRFQDAVLLFLPHVLQSFDANKSYTFSVFPVAKE